MEEQIIDTAAVWQSTQQLFARKKGRKPLFRLWGESVMEQRQSLLFFQLQSESSHRATSKYTSAVQTWWAEFSSRLHRQPPEFQLPVSAPAGLVSLHSTFEQTLVKLASVEKSWILLNARVTSDCINAVERTHTRLRGIAHWFRELSRDWARRQRPDPAASAALRQERAAFLAQYLPQTASEEVQCFARSGCMRAVAACLQVDDQAREAAASIDSRQQQLRAALDAQSEHSARSAVRSCAQTFRVAAARTRDAVADEMDVLQQRAQWADAARHALCTDAARVLNHLRHLAHTACEHSVDGSTAFHEQADWHARRWAFLKDNKWMPPRVN